MAALRKQEQVEVFDPVLGSDEDRELTLSFQRGEPDAYSSIYSRYHRSVYNVCYRMLGQRDDAQEAAQETFLRVYQALGRFNGHYQLGPWIIRIATNVCLDHLRLRKRRPQDVTSIDVLEQEPGSMDDPEQALMKRAEGDRVRAVLSSLPPAHRAAIVLRDYEGLPYRDIALTLGISEGQVKALLHRARKRFRRTWVPAPILLPLHGLLNRFRGRQLPLGAADVARAASPVAEIAHASGSVTSSGMLEHISVTLGEKVAPVVAAAVIGASAVGGSVALRSGAGDPLAEAIATAAHGAGSALDDLTGRPEDEDPLATAGLQSGDLGTGDVLQVQNAATEEAPEEELLDPSSAGDQGGSTAVGTPEVTGQADSPSAGDDPLGGPASTPSPEPTPTPEPSPSPSVSPTPTPEPTPSPSVSPTPTPEPTPSPSVSPSPTPEPTPSPSVSPSPASEDPTGADASPPPGPVESLPVGI